MIRFQLLDILWDAGNREKCRKHGLSTEEIEAFFRQESLYVTRDANHSQTESRLIAVGRMPDGRPAFVVFTLRAGCIRPISARYMHKKEADRYETLSPPHQER